MSAIFGVRGEQCTNRTHKIATRGLAHSARRHHRNSPVPILLLLGPSIVI